ncbi:DNA methyltransferase [Bradyrhizobium japonicum]|uniref:DNA methyltransferase n=1 Tax=Bradyrhizobium japonicum TaxID=375 RepID=UPI002714ADC9|nr:DNA methyltransferase [Bradyrhizobium japonicum]WLB57457.1 DNA methyltransferase [Bradyrhizobium japonicum]
MAKERIVLETTDQRKAALVNSLDLQGESLSDWLEEQLTLSIPGVEKSLSGELSHKSLTSEPDSRKVLAALKQQDWAFTDDDTRYLTHDIHPYPAKFIPQIPAHLISYLSDPGDVVFDPFGGSATTAVEAVRLGRRGVSMDANPLSRFIGRVKTGLMTRGVRAELDQLQAAVASYVTSSAIREKGWAKKQIAQYAQFVPSIPNIEKWFDENAIAELSLLRFLIDETTSDLASDAALTALSRIMVRVSYQESETRYVAEEKDIPPALVLRGFLESLKTIVRRLENAAPDLQRADATFHVGDSRTDIIKTIGANSVDLIVTSPPYPNATDYHLYHRFRLFWLGFDPRQLGAIEIGSHLKHQRKRSGFQEYRDEMSAVLRECYLALVPGRYAAFVVGDAVFESKVFSTSKCIAEAAEALGFELVGTIDRPIHETKRSFAKPGRRARKEQLVVLKKPEHSLKVSLTPPAYKMWPYELQLRRMEIEALTSAKTANSTSFSGAVTVKVSPKEMSALRRLTFSKDFTIAEPESRPQPTWQKILENGDADCARRKDPKYATHGLHPYKGKFYPQLVKSLINISGVQPGSKILDPYCGSGTSVLEGMLNGYTAYGCDMNPLAAKIARAKSGIFSVEQEVVEQALKSLLDRVQRPPKSFSKGRDQFDPGVADELDSWFATPVLNKLEWILRNIRLFGDPRLVEFAEVVLSSIVREVSQQDPTDLRIRRRKTPLADAPVLELYAERLEDQLVRLSKFWKVAGRSPGRLVRPSVIEGDCKLSATYAALGLGDEEVDCVVTSPPYATALPYIDTDRLSLMAIMGIRSAVRSTLEENLTGSREIRKSHRSDFEDTLMSTKASQALPPTVVRALRRLLEANRNSDAGFRKQNMAALLWRYFADMHQNISLVAKALKSGHSAYYVVGDSRTNAGGEWIAIETCKHLMEIAEMAGLQANKLLDISVTTENYKHIKNAITENAILQFRKP